MRERLIDSVMKKREESESWEDFGDRLGCTANYLYRLRTGRRDPGVEWLRRVAQVYPDLQLLTFRYIVGRDGDEK
jgi:hypothetical protein